MQITKQCTGCMACYSACPVGAINIIQNKEGFFVPEINHENVSNADSVVLFVHKTEMRLLKINPLIIALLHKR